VPQSQCIDNEYIADVQVEKGTNNFERMPQLATYPPKGLVPADDPQYKKIAGGAQHCVSGTITVSHRVQAKRRAVGSATNEALNALQKQLDELKSVKSPKFKVVKGSDSDSD